MLLFGWAVAFAAIRVAIRYPGPVGPPATLVSILLTEALRREALNVLNSSAMFVY